MSDLTIVRLSPDLLAEMRALVHWYFRERDWLDVTPEQYRNLVSAAQDSLNTLGFVHRIADNIGDYLLERFDDDDIWVQSNLYLRAARPTSEGQEAVGWHRESMYGCQKEALNIWLPIANCTPENSVQFIPGSAEIPDEQIQLGVGDSGGVDQGSSGHRIGLLYAPKKIIGGVDLTSALPFVLGKNEAAIFSSQLIHGAAVNNTDKIRFSVDFRVIAKRHVGAQKKSFAGDGQDFFVPLQVSNERASSPQGSTALRRHHG